MAQFNEAMTNILGEREYVVSMTGTGNGTVPTLSAYCKGMTLSWTATGRILITWTDNPGTFIGLKGGAGFADSSSQATVKQWEITTGPYPASAGTVTLEIDIWNSSATAADLATTSTVTFTLCFTTIKGVP
jgi:hypothetical protein